MREGWGDCPKYFKGGGTEQGDRAQVFKKRGGKLGQGVDALKRRWTGTPLLTMNDLILPILFILT